MELEELKNLTEQGEEEYLENIEKGIRPAFGSPGGKRYLAKTIVSYIPEHKTYIEPFIGGGAVFFAKEPSEVEVINDLDKEIVFAYKFIKSMTDNQFETLKKKNWKASKILFEKLKNLETDEPLEKFRKIVYLKKLYFKKLSYGESSKNYDQTNEGRDLTNGLDSLLRIKERLKDVKIENNDYKKSINYDSKETFYYLDPPYPETNNVGNIDLADLHKFCKNLKGKFILSLNNKSKNVNMFKDFNIKRVKVSQQMFTGGSQMQMRTELLISNFPLKKENIYLAKSDEVLIEDLPSFMWIPEFINIAGSIFYERGNDRKPNDIDIIVRAAKEEDGKFTITLDKSLRLKIDRVLEKRVGEISGNWLTPEWLGSTFGPNWRYQTGWDLVLVPHQPQEIREMNEPEFAEEFYKRESYEEFCDFGGGHFSKFVKEHPEFESKEFREYVIVHNKADRDSGELEDIAASEILRLAKEFAQEKNIQIEKSKHSREKCMECDEPPVYECIWAEGIGHAWFCKKHFKKWATIGDGKGEIISVKEVKDGIATKKFGDNRNPNIWAELKEDYNKLEALTKNNIEWVIPKVYIPRMRPYAHEWSKDEFSKKIVAWRADVTNKDYLDYFGDILYKAIKSKMGLSWDVVTFPGIVDHGRPVYHLARWLAEKIGGDFVSIQAQRRLENKKILIIDDIVATGATARKAIKRLLDYNPKKIGFAALARSKPRLKNKFWLEKLEKKLSDEETKEYEEETAIINENKKKPLAGKVHEFKGAEWTFPNGHPRCLICGDEELVGGVCNMPNSWYQKHEFDNEEAWKEERKILREKGILKKIANKDVSLDEIKKGLYLVPPHGKLIYENKKTAIVKSKNFNVEGKYFILVSDKKAYGYIECSKGKEIDLEEFKKRSGEHLISEGERREWWPLKKIFYFYKIRTFISFEKPKDVILERGVQTFIEEVQFEKLHLEEFRAEGIDEDMKNPAVRHKELFADLRYLGNSAWPRIIEGKKWKDWTKEDILKYYAAIIDCLRSVFYPVISPKIGEEGYRTSYWECYREARKYMKSKPPAADKEKEWDAKRKEIIKSEQEEIAKFTFKKISEAEHIVGGIVYFSYKTDSQKDWTTPPEVWKALKRFMLKKKKLKVMHEGKEREIPIIENYFVEEQHHKGGMSPKNLLEKGDWWIAIYLGDKENKDIWRRVLKGELTGFSIAGRASSPS